MGPAAQDCACGRPHVRAAGPGRAWGKRGGRGAFRHASLPCYTEGVMVRRQVPSFSTR